MQKLKDKEMEEFSQDIVYNRIANAVIDSVNNIDWIKAQLEIEIDQGFFSFYCLVTNSTKTDFPVKFIKDDNFSDNIRWLHIFTTSMGNTKWNEATCNLDKTGKFSMDFRWNQETQDKVDKINKSKNNK